MHALYLRLNARVLEVVRHFAQQQKPIACICHGAQILTTAGVVKGRKVAAYPTVGPEIVTAGGEYADIPLDQAIVDENLVTAPVWLANAEWLRKFLEVLGTKVVTEAVDINLEAVGAKA